MYQRAVFYRERASGMYSSLQYWLTLLLSEMPWAAVGTLLFNVPLYFMIGFINSGPAFFKYWITSYLVALTYTSISILIAALAPDSAAAGVMQGTHAHTHAGNGCEFGCAVFPFLRSISLHAHHACPSPLPPSLAFSRFASAGMWFSAAFSFSGVAIPAGRIPLGFKWVFEMLPLSHSTEALVMPQFDCSPKPACSPLITVVNGGDTVVQHRTDFVSQYLGLSYDRYGEQIGYLVLILSVIQILAALVYVKVSHIKR